MATAAASTNTEAPPVAAIDPRRASRDFLALIPRDFARDHGLLSQGVEEGAEVLALCATTSLDAAWNVGVRLGRALHTVVVDTEALHAAIDAAYEQAAASSDKARSADPFAAEEDDGQHALDPMLGEQDLDQLLAEADRDLLATEGKAPLVKLMDRLLFGAVQQGASDLHLQPTSEGVIVRHRIDGVLDQGRNLPPALYRPLVSRIKVMGRMDVAERLVPQDGRTSVRIGSRAVDVRISTIPTAYGERVVLRLLDSGNQLVEAASLGMPAHIATPFDQAARRNSGIILVTGPTGSGKTTTLYATLRQLDATERNIMTIEDPIEYELSSLGIPISQTQVNLKKGVNFANGLRHILRQDPDIIMVGEIRDAETARIAIQASLTGHLVFSTLHTNDAVSSPTWWRPRYRPCSPSAWCAPAAPPAAARHRTHRSARSARAAATRAAPASSNCSASTRASVRWSPPAAASATCAPPRAPPACAPWARRARR
jgi:general secretion pathway protein E